MSSIISFPVFPSLGHFAVDAALHSLLALCILLLGIYLYFWVYGEWALSYKNLPGPPSRHFLWGHISQKMQDEPGTVLSAWQAKYGHTFRYRLAFSPRVSTSDPVALNYILTQHELFPKPSLMRKFFTDSLGNGLIFAEGDIHRRQRRVLNPCFGTQRIRDAMPVFYDKAEELRDKLLGLIAEDPLGVASPTPPKPEDVIEGGRKIDMMKFLSECTVDAIGEAGFGYQFNALKQQKNELAEAFIQMFSADQNFTPIAILQTMIPGADNIPTANRRSAWRTKATVERIGRGIIEEKTKAILHAGGLGKGDTVGTDLLSSCIRANMAPDLKPEFKLTDDEVLDQITSFLLAGNETISTALTWTLYLLVQHPECQARLREECMSVTSERPSMEEIFALPYLEGVVHEGLRLWAPLQGSQREALEDVIIPLSTPITGRDGQVMDTLKLCKGTQIFIPTCLVNTSEEIWGPDAKVFNPLRHISPADGGCADETLKPAQNAVPRTYGAILTFLAGGRNCIGYRFALAEIKVVLFVLMRSMEFEELGSKPQIEAKSFILTRPRVVGEEDAGLQMPLMVKPLQA